MDENNNQLPPQPAGFNPTGQTQPVVSAPSQPSTFQTVEPVQTGQAMQQPVQTDTFPSSPVAQPVQPIQPIQSIQPAPVQTPVPSPTLAPEPAPAQSSIPGVSVPPATFSQAGGQVGYQMPQPAKGPKKGLIFGIVGGIVGLLLVITAVIVGLVVFGGPTTEDYAKADEAMTRVVDAYSDMGLGLASFSNLTETESKNNSDKFNSGYEKFKTELALVGESKALKDEEVKKAYDALKDKLSKTDIAVEATKEIYAEIIPVLAKTNSSNSSSLTPEDYSAIFNEARRSFAGLDLKNEFNEKFAKDMSSGYGEIYTIYNEKIKATKAGEYYSLSGYYDVLDKLSDATKDWSSNYKKLTEEGEINDELYHLQDTLISKRYPKK